MAFLSKLRRLPHRGAYSNGVSGPFLLVLRNEGMKALQCAESLRKKNRKRTTGAVTKRTAQIRILWMFILGPTELHLLLAATRLLILTQVKTCKKHNDSHEKGQHFHCLQR